MSLTAQSFLENADHTLLAPGTSREELASFLATARELGVRRVCISPSMLPLEAADRATLEVVTVVGFPSGMHRPEVKAEEAARAVAEGADEIDMVLNRGLVREAAACALTAGEHGGGGGEGGSGEGGGADVAGGASGASGAGAAGAPQGWSAVEEEIRAVREACPGTVLKVILESAALTDGEIVGASRAAAAAGADFVKTSTGFDPAGGASEHAVRLMAQAVEGRIGVKASGGIRDASTVRQLWEAGATRFGVSGTAAILAGWDAADHAAPTSGY